jgi:hypothetical protein
MPSLTASAACVTRKSIGHDRVVGDDGHVDAGAVQDARRGGDPVAHLHLRPGHDERAVQHRDALLGDQVGDLPALGAVIEHQLVAELVGHPQRGGDVVGAVAVLAPRDLAVEHLTAARRAPGAARRPPSAPWLRASTNALRIVSAVPSRVEGVFFCSP